MHHFGDPCIHCSIPHDDVPVGSCEGDPAKAKILAYCVSRQAWENPGSGAETVTCAMSDGSIRDEHWRASYWWWNFPRFKEAECMGPQDFFKHYRSRAA
jgi:hypothetical protein